MLSSLCLRFLSAVIVATTGSSFCQTAKTSSCLTAKPWQPARYRQFFDFLHLLDKGPAANMYAINRSRIAQSLATKKNMVAPSTALAMANLLLENRSPIKYSTTCRLWRLGPSTGTLCAENYMRQHSSLHRLSPPLSTKFVRSPARFCFNFQSSSSSLNSVYSSSGRESCQSTEESKMTSDMEAIYQASIQAVDPVQAIKRHVQSKADGVLVVQSNSNSESKSYHLARDFEKVVIVAFGKASSAMATAVLETVLDTCHGNDSSIDTSGIVIAKDGHATPAQVDFLLQNNISVKEASHPVPDQRGVDASRALLDLVKLQCNRLEKDDSGIDNMSKRTLVICCISGGGSALFCTPHPALSLQDLQATNTALLNSGLGIQDMNVIRKRLEIGKGGGLTALASPNGHVVSLILSDVLGDPLDLIASGPTVQDTSTLQDARNILSNNPNLFDSLPLNVQDLLRNTAPGKHNQVEEDKDQTVDDGHFHCLVGNNALAVLAAANKAHSLGYQPVILGDEIQGEAKDVAEVLVAMAQYAQKHHSGGSGGKENQFSIVPSLPAALIMGGETTVTLATPSGKGGRNQELALAAACILHSKRLRNIAVASIGTDGSDGPTDAAGAVVDGTTIDRLAGAAAKSDSKEATRPLTAVQALEEHNAYPYLLQTDETGYSPLIKTGPTGTNVADIYLALVHEARN